MTDFDPHTYAVSVGRGQVDGELLFKATVKELPDVMGLGETCNEAYDMVIDAITALYEASQEDGRYFPAPVRAADEYSGRFTLRMERSLHRAAALLAEREGTSLNSLISSALAVRVTFGIMQKQPEDRPVWRYVKQEGTVKSATEPDRPR